MRTPPESPPGSDADAALVSRIRAGESAAFDALFRAYYGQLCSFAFAYVRAEDAAEEVVQDVFTAIWTRRREWHIDASVRAYLFGAVRNRALRRSQRGRRERRWLHWLSRPRPPASFASAPVSPDHRLEQAEVEAAVLAAIATLPERSRLAATLRWRHQMSYPEIAAAMGISVKGVENQLARVAKRLREHLAPLRTGD